MVADHRPEPKAPDAEEEKYIPHVPLERAPLNPKFLPPKP